MFACLTKFVPNATGTNYLSGGLIESIVVRGNINPDGTNVIPPQYFDHEIFIDMYIALINYRDNGANFKILQYWMFRDEETRNCITVQIYETQEHWLNSKQSEAHSALMAKRDIFLEKINVSIENVRTGYIDMFDQEFVSTPTNLTNMSYEEIEAIYNTLTPV